MESGYAARVPLFEEGIRPEVINSWHQQGMPDHLDHYDLFHYDRRVEVYPELGPLPEPNRWPTDQESLKKFIKLFDPGDPTRFVEDDSSRAQLDQDSEAVRILRVHRGFFITGGVYEWDRFEELMLLAMDKPGLVQEILKIQGGIRCPTGEHLFSKSTSRSRPL